jgi:L-seryl-tRNA(Ser) seleniumtransferase
MVGAEELAALAHENGLLLFDDLGSGALVDFRMWDLPYEPTVQESLQAGSDVVCFSGDKLVGGPQSGIIVGKKDVIDRMKKNQLSRALRCDKMTFAVLEATLRLFLDERKLLQNHPVIRMLAESPYDVKKRCMSLKRRIKVALGDRVRLRVMEDLSEVGSGSMSSKDLLTWVLSIRAKKMSADDLAEKLRMNNPPIYGRISEDRYLLDCRTIRSDETKFILQGLEKAFGVKRED